MASVHRPLRAPSPSSPKFVRASSPASPRARVSASPPIHVHPRAQRRSSFEAKENISIFPITPQQQAMQPASPKSDSSRASSTNGSANGAASPSWEKSQAQAQTWRDGTISEEDHDANSGARRRSSRTGSRAPGSVSTLPTIRANEELSSLDAYDIDPSRSPPPAPSAHLAHETDGYSSSASNGSVPGTAPRMRRRRSSSIHVKPPPGERPKQAVDWEIPRKTFHSSIGFVTLFLWYMDPPTLGPLITTLSVALVTISIFDFFRLRNPAFAELWESVVGFLMRESERDKINGVVWYLIGVIWVLALYPRDVAVVSILTLSWSDTTASTIGRLWGKLTPPLPSHFPGAKWLRFAPRKSLAGFLAATVTGILITLGFWHNGSEGRWAIIDNGGIEFFITAVVIGLGGAVVEALDLGIDDNLTLPILSGAIIWGWLVFTNVLLGHRPITVW